MGQSLFIPFLVEDSWMVFQYFLVIMNQGAISIHFQVLGEHKFSFLSGKYPEVRFACLKISICLTL